MIREIVLSTLARGGWSAQSAEDGEEVLRKWEEGDFDLILMDLQMPKLSGLEATRKIRESRDGDRVCIIGLTAHVRREVRDECLAAGMDEVLTKPVKMKELLSTLERSLSGRKERRHI